MILWGFLWFGANLILWLIIFTLIAYGSPKSWFGKTLAVIK